MKYITWTNPEEEEEEEEEDEEEEKQKQYIPSGKARGDVIIACTRIRTLVIMK